MKPRLVYAANREIGLRALRLLLETDWEPVGFIRPLPTHEDRVDEMVKLLPPDVAILDERDLRQGEAGLERLRLLRPDYLLSVHYPHIFRREVLEIPIIGTFNLHPSYLPFNRGMHPASWAIVEGTPYGATLHWVDETIDTGDIVLQREIVVRPSDTAHVLYRKALEVELEILAEAIPLFLERRIPRRPQPKHGTFHRRVEIEALKRLEPGETTTVGALIDRLRALTTNRLQDAAYVEYEGVRYRIRVEIIEERE